MSERMLHAMVATGARALVENTTTSLSIEEVDGRPMPLTRDDGIVGGSYVCCPHSAYALYAKRELDLLGGAWWDRFARASLSGVDVVLKAARANVIVHLDNWLMSTNLHGSWTGAGLRQARVSLAERYPDHVIAVRSLDPWSSPGILAAAAADGWILMPSRQIWVTDDLRSDWLVRSNHGHDRRLVARCGFWVEDLTGMTPHDAERICALYRMLYIDRYSTLNPRFTPAFVSLSACTGMMTYRVARNVDGEIVAVAGMWERDGTMTPSIVGYDTGRPRREGLYRLATWLFMDRAEACGWRLNGSAGAGHFKRLRGARGVIERTAYYVGHLNRARRTAFAALAVSLDRLVTPMMKARGW